MNPGNSCECSTCADSHALDNVNICQSCDGISSCSTYAWIENEQTCECETCKGPYAL
eukprot:Awhi_evm1s15387